MFEIRIEAMQLSTKLILILFAHSFEPISLTPASQLILFSGYTGGI